MTNIHHSIKVIDKYYIITLVVDPYDGPHAPDVAVGVAPVQAVVVVEVDGQGEGLLRRLGPLEDLFGPIHPGVNFLVNFYEKKITKSDIILPQVSVRLSLQVDLLLRCIPQRVVSVGLLQLLLCV